MRPHGLSLGRRAVDRFAAGNYLTNGRRLFRVVAQFGSDAPHAELEDCLTLDIDFYEPRQLYAMGLRPVRLAGAG
jgi:hypothetical protein